MYRLLALAAATALMTPVAFAQDDSAESEKSWEVSLAFMSDYKFRGISQTNEDPAVQLTFDWAHESGFYLGSFVSNVDFVPGDGANYELDLYAGYAWDINETVSADISYVQYIYPADNADYDYGELIGSVTFFDSISAMVGFSNDVFASDESALYYGVSGSTSLNDFTFSGSVGYYDLSDVAGGGITDYSVAVARDIGPLTVSVGYYDTNGKLEDFYGNLNDGAAIISFSTVF
jgi:uncharacterized protein (TIGR02001 family)